MLFRLIGILFSNYVSSDLFQPSSRIPLRQINEIKENLNHQQMKIDSFIMQSTYKNDLQDQELKIAQNNLQELGKQRDMGTLKWGLQGPESNFLCRF